VLDLVTQCLRVTDPPPVVVARQLYIERLWDLTGKVSPSLYRNTPVTAAMQNQRGDVDMWQFRPNVSIADALQDGLHCAGTRR
jgi:hypothetical protein